MSTIINLRRGLTLFLAQLLVLTAFPVIASAAPSIPCEGAPSGVFRDVRPGSTHADAIDCLAAYGITVGVGGGNYDPAGHVPRDQMASFLANFLEVALDGTLPPPTASVAFTDVTGVTHAANIVRVAERGVARGRTATRFDPSTDVTRAQMAAFVARTVELIGHEWPTGVPLAFDDHHGSTHQQSIDRLAAAGVVRGRHGRTFEPAGSVTRAQMATFLVNAAALLAEQGLWQGALTDSEGPSVLIVGRAGSAADEVVIRWDREVVDGTAAIGSVTIASSAGDQVATATAVASTDDRSVVSLDAALVAEATYWIELPAGLVADGDGRPNAETSRGFSFVELDGTAGGPGDGTGGGGSGGDAASGGVPVITSAVTVPGADQIELDFDRPVTCPTGGSAAWWFSNDSVVESGSHANGAPDRVEQAASPSTSCTLVYDGDGVEAGDFGTINYTPPADAALRVLTGDGDELALTTDVPVRDGLAPTFTGFVASASAEAAVLEFSEPLECASIVTSDFEVVRLVDDSVIPVASVECTGTSRQPALRFATGALVFGQTVRVTIVGAITDESGDNEVETTSRSAVVGS